MTVKFEDLRPGDRSFSEGEKVFITLHALLAQAAAIRGEKR